jgi:hypothetical protein
MNTHVALGTAVEIRLGKGRNGRSTNHGPRCNIPAPFIGRTFHADGTMEVWPSDARGNRIAVVSGCVCRIDSAGSVTCECAGQCNCVNKREVAATMSRQLTPDEKKICAAFGTSESAFIAARDKRSHRQMHGEVARTFGGVTFTADELAVCRQFGNDPAVIAALRDRRAGKSTVFSSQPRRRENAPSGIIGPPIVSEALQEHRDEVEDGSVDSRRLVMEAQKAIGEFLAHADAPDSWKVLARASALLVGALDRIAPPYADRVADANNRDSQWQ